MSKLSEIEARDAESWELNRDSLVARKDRRYLLGLVKEMRSSLTEAMRLIGHPRAWNEDDGSRVEVRKWWDNTRALLAKLEE